MQVKTVMLLVHAMMLVSSSKKLSNVNLSPKMFWGKKTSMDKEMRKILVKQLVKQLPNSRMNCSFEELKQFFFKKTTPQIISLKTITIYFG